MAETSFDAVAGSLNSKTITVTPSSGVQYRGYDLSKIQNTVIGYIYLYHDTWSGGAWNNAVAHLDSNYPSESKLYPAVTGNPNLGMIRINNDGTIDAYSAGNFTTIFATISYLV